VIHAAPPAFPRGPAVSSGGGDGLPTGSEAPGARGAVRGREGGRGRLHEWHDLAEGAIRVAFHEAVARPDRVGAPLEPAPFRFEPRIRAPRCGRRRTGSSSGPPSGSRRPDLRGEPRPRSPLPGRKAPLSRFDFVFSTMRSRSDVAVEGLQSSDATDVKRQPSPAAWSPRRGGPAAVEKVVRASHSGRDLQSLLGPRHEPPRPRLHCLRDRAGGARDRPEAQLGRAAHRRRPAESREVRCPASTRSTVDSGGGPTPEPHVELRSPTRSSPGRT